MKKMEPRRLHIVVNYMGHRGSGTEYSLDMTRGLLKCGYDVSAILCSDVENMDEWRKLPLRKLVCLRTGDHYKGAIRHTFRLLTEGVRETMAKFADIPVDLFYVPMVNPLSVPFERAFRKRGATTVYTLHDITPHDGEKTLAYLPVHLSSRILARKSSRLTILTERFREATARKHGRKPEDIIITPHGAFSSLAESDSAPEAPIAGTNFLFFGRIVEYKGIRLLAEAYRRLDSELPEGEISLRIVGSGNIEPYMPILSGCRNVKIVNRFIEPDEIRPLMRMDGTVTVLPYTEASQSGVIPTAMLERSPLIVTNLDGLMEQTREGRLALVAEPTADSLYARMKEAIENPGKLQSIASEARDHILELDWSRIAGEMVQKALDLQTDAAVPENS